MLKRDISTVNVLIAAAGGMIGSGWLFTPFISAQIAGPKALLSWILAALFMIFIALPLCELGAMLPLSGGIANYPTFTHGRILGFLFSWITWLSYVVMTPIEIQAILQYSSHFFPQLLVKESTYFKLSGLGYFVAILIMFFVVLLNSYGIKFLAQCNKYTSILKFILPAIAIFALLKTAPSLQNLQPSHLDPSWTSIFTALSTGGIAFAFTGFQNGLMLAGEVQNPQRNIPIAILGAIFIGFILYFLLQLSLLVAIPAPFLQKGWALLSFPGDSGPLVGLTLLLGLNVIAFLLLFDAAFSPFGTTLVYTAATSRILYGMATNHYLPSYFLKLNRHKIPYVTLYANFIMGCFVFLPFPGWQKMVAFLSSTSILSYGIGPICLLALRKIHPEKARPFYLKQATFFCYFAFYVCNLMLYWCTFAVLWKLFVAILIGIGLSYFFQSKEQAANKLSLYWFFIYLSTLLFFSYLNTLPGSLFRFPFDLILLFPFSCLILYTSQRCLVAEEARAAANASLNRQLRENS